MANRRLDRWLKVIVGATIAGLVLGTAFNIYWRRQESAACAAARADD